MKPLKEQAIEWVQNYFIQNGNSDTKALIGISGGKDSSTVAALCCQALGNERVVGVMMPNGEQKDINDSIRLCGYLGIKNYTVNINSAYEGMSSEIKKQLGILQTTPQHNTNTPARLRMATLYSVGANIGNCRISCNGNLSERLSGYFTIWGDGAGDFAPLAYLFKEEVVQLGLDLGLPEDLCIKPPSDGMSGKTDEESLGFTYDELRKVILNDTKSMDKQKVTNILQKINSMAFKRRLLNIPSFVPSDKNIKKYK